MFECTVKLFTGAIGNLFGYYCICLPLAYVFAFKTNLDIYGIWLGLFAGVFTTSIIFLFTLRRIDWNLQANLARARALSDGMSTPMPTTETPSLESVVDAPLDDSGHDQYPVSGTPTHKQIELHDMDKLRVTTHVVNRSAATRTDVAAAAAVIRHTVATAVAMPTTQPPNPTVSARSVFSPRIHSQPVPVPQFVAPPLLDVFMKEDGTVFLAPAL